MGLSARHADVAYLQQEDLQSLGSLLLHLLCGSMTHASIEQVSAHCSPELTHIVASLTGHSEPFASWHQVSLDLNPSHHSYKLLEEKKLQLIQLNTFYAELWCPSCVQYTVCHSPGFSIPYAIFLQKRRYNLFKSKRSYRVRDQIYKELQDKKECSKRYFIHVWRTW